MPARPRAQAPRTSLAEGHQRQCHGGAAAHPAKGASSSAFTRRPRQPSRVAVDQLGKPPKKDAIEPKMLLVGALLCVLTTKKHLETLGIAGSYVPLVA